MSKKIKFSTSLPASLSDFREQGQLTAAKLKVFYFGETADGRIFTEEFAEKLAANIGGTPVVANYDEEEEDFIGHDSVQSVFGFVPENAECSFEIEDGVKWLVTEVKLFTKRHDVGRIAKKIIGKSQSLELNPETVKYEVLEEGRKIEFLDGDLIGLSVLGDNQSPAYTGSGFFSESDSLNIETLIEKYNSIKKEIVFDIDENGGESKLSKEIKLKVLEDGRVVLDESEFVDEVEVPKKKKGKDDEDTNEPVVKIREEIPVDPVDPEPKPEPEPGEGDGDGEEEVDPEPEVEPEVEPEAEPEGEAEEVSDEASGEETFEEPLADEEEEDDDSANSEEMESQAEEVNADEAALNRAEREELNNYRRQAKEKIIASYEEYLTEAERNDFTEGMDDYSVEELDKEVAYISMKSIKNRETNLGKESFQLPTPGKTKVATLDEDVARYI